MRKKIIDELANNYKKKNSQIEDILRETLEIKSYSTKIVKSRRVIDKSKITIEEQITTDYYKLLINRYLFLRFPNRSYIMTELMNILPYIHRYNSYTIYKFDIKSFFYDISPLKSFTYTCKTLNLNSNEYAFLKKYMVNQQGLMPGIGLHNSLVEVCGGYFDLAIKKTFKDGFLYYSRYVDDCILVLDEITPELKIEKIVNKLLIEHFGKNTKINNDKSLCVNSNFNRYKFDYLGYEIKKWQADHLEFGIANKKLTKYEQQIQGIVLEYKLNNDLEILNLKLELMFKRLVYYGKRKESEYSRWQVRGISDSYKELKRLMMNNEDYNRISRDTQRFFEKSIENSFSRNSINIPSKINNQIKNKKFVSCFLNNNALLLHNKLGLSYNDLKRKFHIISDDSIGNFSYSELANLFITKIK